MAKAASSIVDEIAAAIPEPSHGKPWWVRLTPEQAELVQPVLQAWKQGRFGKQKITAARAISTHLTRHGIKIGPQGVLAWLQKGE
jgi:hypothetical protein